MLSGEDLMDRTPMKPTCKADGQTLKIDFGETRLPALSVSRFTA
ncbi:MAG: hypothetical protein ACLU0O_02470 [Collinsella sp.]